MWSASKVSVWWPTPSDPYRHFSAEQIDASDRYFRPLRRAAALSLLVKALFLVVATLAAGLAAKSDFVDALGFMPRVVFGALITTAALRVPSIVVDTWFEYRHQLQIDNHVPVPKSRFSKVVVGYTIIHALIVTVCASAFYFVAQRTDAWPLLAALALLIGATFAALRQLGILGFGATSGQEPDPNVTAELQKVATRFDLPDLEFRVLASEQDQSQLEVSHGKLLGGAFVGEHHEGGLNAFSIGLGSNRRVVISEALLSESSEARDFIVGHELAHQAKQHLATQAVVTVALYLIAVGSMAWIIGGSWPWEWLGIEPLDPVGLPALILILCALAGVLTPLKSWVSRGHERVADEMAATVLEPPSVQLSHRIHSALATDLRPPRWAQIYATHPAPPERLEFLARLRRSSGAE